MELLFSAGIGRNHGFDNDPPHFIVDEQGSVVGHDRGSVIKGGSQVVKLLAPDFSLHAQRKP